MVMDGIQKSATGSAAVLASGAQSLRLSAGVGALGHVGRVVSLRLRGRALAVDEPRDPLSVGRSLSRGVSLAGDKMVRPQPIFADLDDAAAGERDRAP